MIHPVNKESAKRKYHHSNTEKRGTYFQWIENTRFPPVKTCDARSPLPERSHVLYTAPPNAKRDGHPGDGLRLDASVKSDRGRA